MNFIFSIYRLFERTAEFIFLPLLPLLARLAFAGGLLMFFLNSARTKFGTNPFSPSINAYAQILPGKAEAGGYSLSAFSWLDWLIVMGGTYGEVLLPLLLVLGLCTRLAAAGMIVFVAVMTWVDVTAHQVELGAFFNRHANEIIDMRGFWVICLLVLLAMGGGRISLDALICRLKGGRR